MILGRKRPRNKINAGIHSFTVRTRIAKSTGEDKRYKLNAVRALPTRQKGKVALQASNGQQAVCVLTPGRLSSSRLVPSKLLPTRKGIKSTVIELVGDHWQSSEGKTEPDHYAGESCYPPIADALPRVNGRPFYINQGDSDKDEPSVLLGIDLSLLSRVAESLGTPKLTLIVPIPVKASGDISDEVYVNKPVAVCPATDESGVHGVGVVVPLQPMNGKRYYVKLRQTVADAERKGRSNSNQRRPVGSSD